MSPTMVERRRKFWFFRCSKTEGYQKKGYEPPAPHPPPPPSPGPMLLPPHLLSLPLAQWSLFLQRQKNHQNYLFDIIASGKRSTLLHEMGIFGKILFMFSCDLSAICQQIVSNLSAKIFISVRGVPKQIQAKRVKTAARGRQLLFEK